MPTYPGALLPWIDSQFHDLNGEPLAGGQIYFFVVGTSTPKDTFADAQLTQVNTNPVICDAEGRVKVFLAPGGYDVAVYDALGALLFTREAVEDQGLTFLDEIGVLQLQGPGEQSDGYVIQATPIPDRYVPVNSNSTNPTVIYLPPANTYRSTLVVKNVGSNPVELTPDGSDEIDRNNAPLTIPAGSAGGLPAVTMSSDGISAWVITGAFMVP